ncbi:MAG TPA: hypothetical protein VLG16_04015 [Candidatus Saccharimonadales bacterium]|nr:hypothetical protein [Candidatus Saccharimonadales bacterium]
MHLTKSEIFWKCWLWGNICGIITAIIFWFISSVGNVFHFAYGGTAFIDLLIIAGIAGAYFGSGYIGNRIAVKYYHDQTGRFKKTYVRYSIYTFIVLVAITYSPVSFLSLLWSFIAPFCTIQALAQFMQKKPAK